MAAMTPAIPDFIAELRWRGLLHQCTDEDGLRQHLADPAGSPRRAYAGFDPTADSLTIGNLVPMMLLIHFARAGHQPVVVMGGGTGLIGDPSGKSAERQLQSEERVRANVEAQRGIFERLFSSAGLAVPPLRNNLDWLGKLGFLEVLRDIGKHFSVNMMIQKDSVRERLNTREQGISYTEFSYMILQSYDFLHLWRSEAVTVQIGGSDQWGNIVAGRDLVMRHAISVLSTALIEQGGGVAWLSAAHPSGLDPDSTFGLTNPLITKADGGKFGKTESGAIWLTAPSGPDDKSTARTSIFAYYQFWLNTSDADVERYLKTFTLLTRDEIASLMAAQQADPAARPAQRALARAATTLLHSAAAMEQAEAAAKALFSGDVASLPASTLDEVLADVPRSEHPRASLEGQGLPLVDLLPQTTLAKSKREAREFLAAGSVLVNGRKAGPDEVLRPADLLHGTTIAIRRGKKSWHVTRWV